jgi:hypothetical protein
MKPWMTWEKLYQSASCCDISGLKGLLTQNDIRPLAATRGWPKLCSTAICVPSSAIPVAQYKGATRTECLRVKLLEWSRRRMGAAILS